MFPLLLARLFTFAWTKIAPAASIARAAGSASAGRRGAIGLALTAGAVAADLLNIDELRQEAVRIAPTSDPEALEEAARQLMRMVGADGSEVLWPGNGVSPRYYHFDLSTGRQWFTGKYYSFKTVRAANNRGFSRGVQTGTRRANAATMTARST